MSLQEDINWIYKYATIDKVGDAKEAIRIVEWVQPHLCEIVYHLSVLSVHSKGEASVLYAEAASKLAKIVGGKS